MKIFAKIVLASLALLNGIGILHYGLYALINGRFSGKVLLDLLSDMNALIAPLEINVYSVGAVFVLYSFAWLFFGTGVVLGKR